MIALRIGLFPALPEVSFEERAHLLLEPQQALVQEIQALADLCSEILFRALRALPINLWARLPPASPEAAPASPEAAPASP